MPINASKKTCNLFYSDENNMLESEFYSTYYLNQNDSVIENSKNIDRLDFDTSLNFDRQKTFPKIIFLGTVSARSTSHRNNTSILVHTTYVISIKTQNC